MYKVESNIEHTEVVSGGCHSRISSEIIDVNGGSVDGVRLTLKIENGNATFIGGNNEITVKTNSLGVIITNIIVFNHYSTEVSIYMENTPSRIGSIHVTPPQDLSLPAPPVNIDTIYPAIQEATGPGLVGSECKFLWYNDYINSDFLTIIIPIYIGIEKGDIISMSGFDKIVDDTTSPIVFKIPSFAFIAQNAYPPINFSLTITSKNKSTKGTTKSGILNYQTLKLRINYAYIEYTGYESGRFYININFIGGTRILKNPLQGTIKCFGKTIYYSEIFESIDGTFRVYIPDDWVQENRGHVVYFLALTYLDGLENPFISYNSYKEVIL